MQRDDWERLSSPFPLSSLGWRITEIADDRLSARVLPQLDTDALRERLDQVVGVEGWSLAYRSLGDGVIACELTIGGVTKSALAAPRPGRVDPVETGDAALARAAELFALRPPVDPKADYWVDYDAESGEALHSPDLTPPAAVAPPGTPPPDAPVAPVTKPAGQQAIDRLVERLKAQGQGLEAAKLLNSAGGYGKDPEAARELYAKLRALLLGGETAP